MEELRAELPKPPSRSSVRKLLDIMIERGLLAREYDGPRFAYFPVAKPEEASRSALIRQLLQTFFNDSPSSAVAALLDAASEPLSDAEYKRLNALLEKGTGTWRPAMTIIAILLKASLLLAAVVLAQALIGKRLSATSRHLLWTLAIVGLLVLPLLYGMLPTWTVARFPPSRAPELARMAQSAVTRFTSEMTSSLSAPVGSADRQLPGIHISWSTVASVAYGIGLLAFLLRLVAQRWSVRRLVHRATRIRDRGMESPAR